MPNNQLARQRQVRRAGMMGALAAGVNMAYNNRQMISQVTKQVKQLTTRKRQRTNGTKPVIATYAGGNDLTRAKGYVSRSRKPRTNSAKIALNRLMIKAMMQPSTFRVQGLTNYDTNLGYYTLRNAYRATPEQKNSPVHVWNLTTIPNQTTAPVAGYQLGWSSLSAAADVVRERLPSQSPQGIDQTNGQYYNEIGDTAQALNVHNGYHDWTSVAINFYGPRSRTTWFEVIFFQPVDEFADPFLAAVTNAEYKQLLQYMERPCIYSNLQTDVSGKGYRKMKIVKRFKYFVSASQTTDVDTSVGKIKQAKIFIRHGKMLDYDWQNNGVLPHTTQDGVDYVSNSADFDYPAPKQRLYMMIRAFSPQIASGTTEFPALDANRDPTYDMVIRNHFTFPKSQ